MRFTGENAAHFQYFIEGSATKTKMVNGKEEENVFALRV